jgi:hypothetical protein
MDDFVPVPGFEGLYEVSRGGERVGTSKLTNEKVLYARQLRKDGYSYSQIAAKIGVTKMPARLAVNGITWSHVLPPNPE